ncbi:hypothetical protein ACEUZ9_000881 [Paracoccus litorisediminis]|uniref:hypothetical protein n=1 Tax=Paracoccus litorisediminis TaxID=2006130 RepID=UPI00372EB60E
MPKKTDRIEISYMPFAGMVAIEFVVNQREVWPEGSPVEAFARLLIENPDHGVDLRLGNIGPANHSDGCQYVKGETLGDVRRKVIALERDPEIETALREKYWALGSYLHQVDEAFKALVAAEPIVQDDIPEL